MRINENEKLVKEMMNHLMNIDFHHFIIRQEIDSDIELAEEFGISIREVKALRRKLKR